MELGSSSSPGSRVEQGPRSSLGLELPAVPIPTAGLSLGLSSALGSFGMVWAELLR